ncbi:predicted protein [Sclerotinia sclerotiorum 1980 UF-70]|uniref:Uncharacterized protein n=1 Tax=Sclerotinia sclerotiorum (strain ATCC 18683 / 1980 / Ss-1) TaxID=665079 RepID=A7F489_SCLS1|nr:predicted protein [Sclerotinia sclerotiorum 1980 UF-70]EDN97560.1 predicted protein [Sclerotinia sclerotiorum 1980 UF-70]
MSPFLHQTPPSFRVSPTRAIGKTSQLCTEYIRVNMRVQRSKWNGICQNHASLPSFVFPPFMLFPPFASVKYAARYGNIRLHFGLT